MTNSYIYTQTHSIISLSSSSIGSISSSATGSIGRPIPLRCNGLICPSRGQLLMYSILSIFMHDRLNLSHEHVRHAPENARSGSDDSAGIDRIDIAILLGCGYRSYCSFRHHHSRGVQSIWKVGAFIDVMKSSSSPESDVVTSISRMIDSRIAVRSFEGLDGGGTDSKPRGETFESCILNSSSQIVLAALIAGCSQALGQLFLRYAVRREGSSKKAAA
jgi:hypothetical protein